MRLPLPAPAEQTYCAYAGQHHRPSGRYGRRDICHGVVEIETSSATHGFIGVPNPVLFGILTMVLRFVPYIGAFIAAIFPIALAVAVDLGWSMALMSRATNRRRPLWHWEHRRCLAARRSYRSAASYRALRREAAAACRCRRRGSPAGNRPGDSERPRHSRPSRQRRFDVRSGNDRIHRAQAAGSAALLRRAAA